jgi:hypothetical protein
MFLLGSMRVYSAPGFHPRYRISGRLGSSFYAEAGNLNAPPNNGRKFMQVSLARRLKASTSPPNHEHRAEGPLLAMTFAATTPDQ